ncbi:MAG TPA: ribosome biogenesis GTPase Der [Stellaceae bacterium]|jgi:GTP-binding protein|nr:ribosome biogenesis GTPase Der [Stellaceae bacterium]
MSDQGADKRVAIIGRPNVGKSTLFNRLAGKKLALVHDLPGVTRDRREAPASLADLRFTIVDTAGLDDGEKGSLTARMRAQTLAALDHADAILFMVDAKAGLLGPDREFAQLLRRRGRKVILVANKAEGRGADSDTFFALGLGEPIPLSAEHGEGLGELYSALAPLVREGQDDSPQSSPPRKRASREEPDSRLRGNDGDTSEAMPDKPLQLAVVGRPNVGKSTLVNQLLGTDRMLTGPEAGITRDAIAIDWDYRGRKIRLFDTAGMRRRPRVTEKLEQLAVSDAREAIRFAEVCVLVVDATHLLEKQDLTIAREIAEEGRAVVLAVNKWDLVADKSEKLKDMRETLETGVAQLAGISVITLSAKTGNGMNKLLPAVLEAYEVWNRRVPTSQLNRWLEEAQSRNPPPLVSGRRLRLRYMTQANIRPPTFALFASKPGDLPDSYRRYLTNQLRESFDLPGTPIRMMLRKGKNPYDDKWG